MMKGGSREPPFIVLAPVVVHRALPLAIVRQRQVGGRTFLAWLEPDRAFLPAMLLPADAAVEVRPRLPEGIVPPSAVEPPP